MPLRSNHLTSADLASLGSRIESAARQKCVSVWAQMTPDDELWARFQVAGRCTWSHDDETPCLDLPIGLWRRRVGLRAMGLGGTPHQVLGYPCKFVFIQSGFRTCLPHPELVPKWAAPRRQTIALPAHPGSRWVRRERLVRPIPPVVGLEFFYYICPLHLRDSVNALFILPNPSPSIVLTMVTVD